MSLHQDIKDLKNEVFLHIFANGFWQIGHFFVLFSGKSDFSNAENHKNAKSEKKIKKSQNSPKPLIKGIEKVWSRSDTF